MKTVMIAVAALVASGSAFAGAHASGGASGPSWTYLDGGYLRTTGGDEDNEGYQFRGSIEFATKWHARFEYADFEFGAPSGFSDTSVDGYRLVLGGHPAITDRTDLVFEVSYFDFDNELNGPEGESDGFTIASGIRSMLTDNTEVHAGVQATSGDNDFGSSSSSSDFSDIEVTLGGQYLFTDNFGVGADVIMSGGNLANFYLRYSF